MSGFTAAVSMVASLALASVCLAQPTAPAQTEPDGHPKIAPERIHRYERQDVVLDDFQASGYVLDIGGGGEGIIGLLKPAQVVAIDLSARELAQAPPGPLKIVMDATDLKFLDGTFGTATSFFTLMYMKPETQRRRDRGDPPRPGPRRAVPDLGSDAPGQDGPGAGCRRLPAPDQDAGPRGHDGVRDVLPRRDARCGVVHRDAQGRWVRGRDRAHHRRDLLPGGTEATTHKCLLNSVLFRSRRFADAHQLTSVERRSSTALARPLPQPSCRTDPATRSNGRLTAAVTARNARKGLRHTADRDRRR